MGAEIENTVAMGADLVRRGDAQQFQEIALQLDQPVVGSPGMVGKRRQGEAQALIGAGRFIQVADAQDEVVDPPPDRHKRRLRPSSRRCRRRSDLRPSSMR